ncbi:hypothetical protein HC028_01525 [Planosporangium flavigriseum]|uniref:Uncharacterized protein n=1 Tax=Planosporangium flavigriseum TaxID=373681 RepID=A0A8J3PKT1_9ACTN|nr:hypothetical protein [Planosporangium flavigriseum]NJC63196.1 hypothetical protein [Planosporangium flavigriseum]GIG72469.1 hypothetical protein Pfl04_08730 [Planosporangium flavigriseum]
MNLLSELAEAAARLRRGARRLRGLVMVAMLAALMMTVATAWFVGRGTGNASGGDQTVGDVVRVGVVDGASVPDYEQRSRAELADLVRGGSPGELVALVTLRGYLTPDQLAPALGGVALTQVYARVPEPHLQTQIVRLDAYRVPDDVTGGMDRVAAKKDAEAADYARLAANLGTTDSERELRAVYTKGHQIAAVEAAGYRSHCACVYAAVVRATPAALDQLARRGEVRVVDPTPEVRRLDRAVFLPPLPEQRERVTAPDNSGQPTASPAVARR